MPALADRLHDLSDIDAQLAMVQQRRDQALDLLIRCLIELDTTSNRADVLLDRRLALLSD